MKQPGDKLASAMEYMPGKGVYEEKGELFAGVCGEVKEDNENDNSQQGSDQDGGTQLMMMLDKTEAWM